ncbi:MAG: Mth938-like domain-containing protein [Paracoccaceae bacterium]
MHINEVAFPDARPVEGYGPGFFRIGGRVHRGPILILPDGVVGWNGWDDTDALVAAAAGYDVLFAGTGAEIAHPPEDFVVEIERAGPGVEAMSSPAACRTYNVLIAEGRRIAVALIPV